MPFMAPDERKSLMESVSLGDERFADLTANCLP